MVRPLSESDRKNIRLAVWADSVQERMAYVDRVWRNITEPVLPPQDPTRPELIPACVGSTPNARLPQKSRLSSGASIAPGITSMIALSTISITVIEIVSAARAILTAAAKGSPGSRAVVRDTVGQNEAASKIGYITMGMALIPLGLVLAMYGLMPRLEQMRRTAHPTNTAGRSGCSMRRRGWQLRVLPRCSPCSRSGTRP